MLLTDGNALIPAKSPPKGGAVSLYDQPKFVQSVCVKGGRGTSSNYHFEIKQGHTALLESC